jgi:chromate transporter
MEKRSSIEKPPFAEALKFWSKLGWISFGGTAGHIAIMHDYLVERKRWISNQKFLHALSLCMLLPGPEAQQLAIYIGWQLHGKRGAILAGTLFVLPSMFILLALSMIYAKFGSLPWVAAVFSGLKPAVIALVAIALLKVARKALRSVLHYFVAISAFVGMYFFNVSLLLIILFAILFALLVAKLSPSYFRGQLHAPEAEDEHLFYINKYSSKQSGFGARSAFKIMAITTLLWLMPFAAAYFLLVDFPFWERLILFFSKTAFVTVGGSYTVIPYVARFAVTRAHWLSNLQMADGFALAETTPGPLIIVLAFVGFMASYNHFNGSIFLGTLGLLATTFYTFLPCFLFVLVGAPLVEKSQESPVIEGVLGFITAVVVGAILDLTIFLGKGVLIPCGTMNVSGLDVIALSWAVLSFALIKIFRLNVAVLVLLSVGFGLIRFACSSI